MSGRSGSHEAAKPGGLFGRLGNFVVRRPLVVIASWIVFAGVLALIFPPLPVQAGKQDAFDKFDADKSIEQYADQLGVNPELIVADDRVALVRQERAQAQAAAAAAETARVNSETARNLGGVQTGAGPGDNAATDILNLFSGYQSPAGTEL